MNDYPSTVGPASPRGPARAGRVARRSPEGFGTILFFWALMLSLVGGVTLVASGFALGNGWAVLAGVAALFLYGRLGALGHDLLDRLLPYDG